MPWHKSVCFMTWKGEPMKKNSPLTRVQIFAVGYPIRLWSLLKSSWLMSILKCCQKEE